MMTNSTTGQTLTKQTHITTLSEVGYRTTTKEQKPLKYYKIGKLIQHFCEKSTLLLKPLKNEKKNENQNRSGTLAQFKKLQG